MAPRVAITLPDAVARMLLDLGEWGLPALAGVTTAPLLAADGSILVSAGYDSAHAMWCEPVPDLTVPDRPTRAQADAALLLLRTAFRTFPFAGSPMVERGAIMVVDTSKPPSACGERFPGCTTNRLLPAESLARAWRADCRAGGLGGRQRQRAAGEGDLPDRIWLPAFRVHTRARPAGTRQATGGSA